MPLYGEANPAKRPEVRAKISAALRRKPSWDEAQISTLKREFPRLFRKEMQLLFPLRSWSSILAKAKRLGLKRDPVLIYTERSRGGKRQRDRLAPEERQRRKLQYLREYWQRPAVRAQRKRKAKEWQQSDKGKTWKRNYDKQPGVVAKRRERSRERVLTIHVNGVNVRLTGLKKRPRPSECELCGKSGEMPGSLGYHHWGDNANKGIWICYPCHVAAEALEKRITEGFIQKYQALKEMVEASCI